MYPCECYELHRNVRTRQIHLFQQWIVFTVLHTSFGYLSYRQLHHYVQLEVAPRCVLHWKLHIWLGLDLWSPALNGWFLTVTFSAIIYKSQQPCCSQHWVYLTEGLVRMVPQMGAGEGMGVVVVKNHQLWKKHHWFKAYCSESYIHSDYFCHVSLCPTLNKVFLLLLYVFHFLTWCCWPEHTIIPNSILFP